MNKQKITIPEEITNLAKNIINENHNILNPKKYDKLKLPRRERRGF